MNVTRRAAVTAPRTSPLAAVPLVLALAAAPPAVAEVKVGFVDLSDLLRVAPQAQAARERIEREFAPRDRALLARRQELRRLEDELRQNEAVMSAPERRRQELEIRARRRELRRLRDWFREDLNLRRSQAFSRLQQKVMKIVRSVAESRHYDLVLTDGVLYASDEVDLGEAVLRRLEAEYARSKS